MSVHASPRAATALGTDALLLRLVEVHERPRYDLAPELRDEDPVNYELAVFGACR